jgi:hypothetical protein
MRGVLLVALTAGIFGVLPRLGGLTRDAAGLRHARPAFLRLRLRSATAGSREPSAPSAG